VEGYEGVEALSEGVPPNGGCTPGAHPWDPPWLCWRVGRDEGWRVEVDDFYASSFFNLSRMSLMRDCWDATVASRLETWFSSSAMHALSACC